MAESARDWEDDMGTLGTVTVPNVVITLGSALEPQTKMVTHCFSFFKDHIWLSLLGRLTSGCLPWGDSALVGGPGGQEVKEEGDSPREQRSGRQAPRGLATAIAGEDRTVPLTPPSSCSALPHALTVFVDCQALLQLGWGTGSKNLHGHVLSRT